MNCVSVCFWDSFLVFHIAISLFQSAFESQNVLYSLSSQTLCWNLWMEILKLPREVTPSDLQKK